jgi:hypothetical protein
LKSLQISLERIKKARAAFDLEHATRFSAFEAILPGETGLSRVLKFLLDDEAAHGQGPTFLHQFLDLIGCPDCKSRSFHAATEYPTRHGRRIDILLRSRDYLIGIENKPWASEQLDQCKAYAKDLEWQMRGRWTLVFLTADGRRPETCGVFAPRTSGGICENESTGRQRNRITAESSASTPHQNLASHPIRLAG